MTPFVLDASVALSWILDNPVPAIAIRVQQALIAKSRAVIPALWHLEIANALVVAERRKLLTASDGNAALLQLENLSAQALEVESEVEFMRHAWETARAYDLSAYDSVYLNLAIRKKLPLATLDTSLRRAAAKAGVELLR